MTGVDSNLSSHPVESLSNDMVFMVSINSPEPGEHSKDYRTFLSVVVFEISMRLYRADSGPKL